MAAARHWDCCSCCLGIAKDDHVEHGGSIEKDAHDGPCDTCHQTYHANSHDITTED